MNSPTVPPVTTAPAGPPTDAPADDAIRFGSHVYSLTPSGPLGTAAHIEITLDRPATEGLAAVVVTRETDAGPWTYLRGAFTADRSAVSFTTTHLSDYGILLVDTGVLFGYFKKYFLDGFTGGLTAEADRPTCTGEKAARRGGFTISSTNSEVVYSCFGYDAKLAGDKRVLKYTNNRPYFVMLSHFNMDVLKNEHSRSSWANLTRVMDRKHEVVEPRGTVVLNADLEPGQSESAQTEFDGFSHNLYAAQVAFYSLLAILTRGGSVKGSVALDVINKAFSVPKCYDALTDSFGAVVANCFSPDAIAKSFGNAGLLLAVIMATADFGTFLTKASNQAFWDLLADRDKYKVLITRKAPPVPGPDFAKTWIRHGEQMVIATNGTGTLRYRTYSETASSPGQIFGIAKLSLRMATDGRTAIATVTSSRYDYGDEPGTPPTPPKSYRAYQPGTVFTLKKKPNGALNEHPGSTLTTTPDDLAWCTATAFDDPQCGA